jgi:hypothetical protein
MTEGVAIEMARSLMSEHGKCGADYLIRYRHLRLKPAEIRVLKASNEYYIVATNETIISVRSKAGVFDLNNTEVNEQQHIHRGQITLHNATKSFNDITFIQIITINK